MTCNVIVQKDVPTIIKKKHKKKNQTITKVCKWMYETWIDRYKKGVYITRMFPKWKTKEKQPMLEEYKIKCKQKYIVCVWLRGFYI